MKHATQTVRQTSMMARSLRPAVGSLPRAEGEGAPLSLRDSAAAFALSGFHPIVRCEHMGEGEKRGREYERLWVEEKELLVVLSDRPTGKEIDFNPNLRQRSRRIFVIVI